MARDDDARGDEDRGWRCANVWADGNAYESNAVKQLLVPASMFNVVAGSVGALELRNNYGT
jgi:hypothetical protein